MCALLANFQPDFLNPLFLICGCLLYLEFHYLEFFLSPLAFETVGLNCTFFAFPVSFSFTSFCVPVGLLNLVIFLQGWS